MFLCVGLLRLLGCQKKTGLDGLGGGQLGPRCTLGLLGVPHSRSIKLLLGSTSPPNGNPPKHPSHQSSTAHADVDGKRGLLKERYVTHNVLNENPLEFPFLTLHHIGD